MNDLIEVVQSLSLARDLPTVMEIVRRTARDLTGADGATFVLRDGEQCFYAAENAISPLWKGQRFPLEACVSGWVMLNRRPAVIDDIYADPRVPTAAYRPTFVKSLVMVPIRTVNPVGAIGNYWAKHHRPSPEQVHVLQALADTTAVAMENVRVYEELRRNARELQETIDDLESFSYSIAHDLRGPLRAIDGFAHILTEELGPGLADQGERALGQIHRNVARMADLLDDLLVVARAGRHQQQLERLDTRRLVDDVLSSVDARNVEFRLGSLDPLFGDRTLTLAAVNNLVDNAIKFSRRSPRPVVEITCAAAEGETVFCVKDNGIGFDPQYAKRIFRLFERLHTGHEYEGNGVGLALVQRIAQRHGGRVWADGAEGRGAAFYLALPGG